ncbi:hypothetical protein [Pedobacter punctiformis]|uniref:DUF748 domain-containing protein n=1 Tax=Pedobacter punctiformis TaxID=3004097 RepID=A0ABT4L594_9SPHI|nr:hypothetical protein [Pedobacter sp. HCMS5-2]MCZ4243096.1 hypothetical protein [Pedobacter sp. HCMS5-2]
MPEKKRYRYKVIKWIGAVLLILFIILAGIAWYLNYKSKPAISEQIKSLIYKSTDRLYTISFTNITTNILTGHAVLRNVKITPDTNRYHQLIALKRAPNNLYEVSLKKLVIKNFHPFTVYREHKLQIDEVLFDKPDVSMMNKQFDFNENRPPRPIQSPYTFISKLLKEFSIQTILFKDASFKYINKNLPKAEIFSIKDLNITLTDLLIDSTSAQDPKRLYLLKDVLINLNDYTYPTPDKMYDIKLSQLDFRASTGKLRIKKFALVPLYDEMKFGSVAGYAKDRFNIQMSDILLNGIDLPLYIKKQELRAKEMAIANGFVSVFNNRNLPKREKENRIGRFPHQLLQKLEAPILVEKIILKEININYSVFDDQSKQKGRISFDHTSGTITNATNIEKVKAVQPIMESKLSTYLMGQGKLDVDFKFDLQAKNGAFSYAGVLHSTNARTLNQITRPLGLVQINRGYVDKLDFNFSANDSTSKGKVNFSYYDLSVALMRNDPEKGHLVKRGFLSFLANALIINSENPDRNGKFISADVVYSRPANTSFFNLIWRSLFIGIKHSVGLTEEKQNEVREHIAKFKAIKASRKERKQKRIERRRQRAQEEREEKR